MKTLLRLLSPAPLLLVLWGCPGPTPPICTIAPPEHYQGSVDTSQKVSADLTKVTSAPINVDLENSYKQTIDETFQKLNDNNAACQMVLQSIVCMSQRDNGHDLAMAMIKYVSDKNVCGPAITKTQELFSIR